MNCARTTEQDAVSNMINELIITACAVFDLSKSELRLSVLCLHVRSFSIVVYRLYRNCSRKICNTYVIHNWLKLILYQTYDLCQK